MNITILGSGGWGCALAIMTSKNGEAVTVWSPFEDEIAQLQSDREHKKLLPGVKFPDGINLTTDISCVNGADIIILAVPSNAVRDTARLIADKIPEGQIVVNVAKGIENDTLKQLSTVIEEELPNASIAVLTGPSHAEEVSRGIPTAVTVASKNTACAEFVQSALISNTFRVYINNDLIGVELGGALKNIIALVAGISDGIRMGDNTRAALMTRGLSEIARLGSAMGANKETFAGLSGLGDLIVTCSSRHSRNHRAGVLIGEGIPAEEAVRKVGVVEGYPATLAAHKLGLKYGVELPIIEQCYQVLYGGKSPQQGVMDLMKRPKRHELEHNWLND
ncbi:MAG: NAD(P)-dependent glycerol-3-phosphate dehydrogenase [Clostridia bacterium]|nr:NAD(P)-dependent glycerol-3-phosphate dehydrogenase [Clostridia bacterium]